MNCCFQRVYLTFNRFLNRKNLMILLYFKSNQQRTQINQQQRSIFPSNRADQMRIICRPSYQRITPLNIRINNQLHRNWVDFTKITTLIAMHDLCKTFITHDHFIIGSDIEKVYNACLFDHGHNWMDWWEGNMHDFIAKNYNSLEDEFL